MRLLLLTLLLISLPSAFAQQEQTKKGQSKLEIGAGVFAFTTPDYPGSEERTSYLVPLPYFHYESDEFTVDREGFTGWFFKRDNWYADISLSAGIPVNSKDNQARQGMPDLDWTLEIGPSMKYYWQGKPNADDYLFAEFYLRKVIATDFTFIDDIGWRSGVRLSHQRVFPLNNGDTLEWANTFDTSSANHALVDYFYGVSPQFQTPERDAYQANGGYAGSRLSSGILWKKQDLWFGAFMSVTSLHGSTQEHSPLVDNKLDYSAGIGVIWVFYEKLFD